jgi:hypothetical protein
MGYRRNVGGRQMTRPAMPEFSASIRPRQILEHHR